MNDRRIESLKLFMDSIINSINARHIYNVEPIKYAIKQEGDRKIYERVFSDDAEAMILAQVAIARSLIFGDINERMSNPIIGAISERIRKARDGEINAEETLDWLLAIFRNGIK